MRARSCVLQPGRGARAAGPRTASRGACARRGDLVLPGVRVPLPQPPDRPVPRRRRRARRHAGHPLRVDRAKPRLAGVDDGASLGALTSTPDRDPPGAAPGGALDVAAGSRGEDGAGSRPAEGPFTVDLPMVRCTEQWASRPPTSEVWSALVPDAKRGNMDTPRCKPCHVLPRCQRARGALLDRRRSRPAGRG